MNYLAHAFLSFDDPFVLTGNIISDYVKGKKQFDYPGEVHNGIRLHRLIDDFTDTHPITAEAKKIFSAHYRLYSGPIIDVVFDHYLALDLPQFQPFGGLYSFSTNVYLQLDSQAAHFPFSFQHIYPYMRAQNWLYNYKYRDGMYKALTGLVHRSKYMAESDTAFKLFNDHYRELRKFYCEFFPQLKEFAYNHYTQLTAE